jgi:hypothetical protein
VAAKEPARSFLTEASFVIPPELRSRSGVIPHTVDKPGAFDYQHVVNSYFQNSWLDTVIMKLSAAFAVFTDLRLALQIAFWPTLVSIWQNPFFLLHPQKLSQVFMAHMWVVFGKGVDENGRPIKQQLITPHATGLVLDLGAGVETRLMHRWPPLTECSQDSATLSIIWIILK